MGSPNILLVVLDSVRAKNCGLYGHDNETTPFLCEFADDATVFDQARAPGIHSIASHASIFSGTHVAEHRLNNHESYLEPQANIWHKLRTEYGYSTGAFSPNIIVTETSNLTSVFDTFEGPRRRTSARVYADGLTPADIEGSASYVQYLLRSLGHAHPMKSLLNGLNVKLTDTSESHDPETESADVYVDMFFEWLDQQSGPWAGFINLMDAHYPYVPKPEHDRWGGEPLRQLREALPDGTLSETFLQGRPWGQIRALESLYDGCIHQLDAKLARLVSTLKRRGEFEDTLIVITSDHGEGFGERSRVTPSVRMVDHSWGIHEVLTHVPLVVKKPRQTSGRRISSVATLTEFPSVVRATVRDEPAAERFVPDDDPIVSSTFRIKPPGDPLPIPQDERKPYFGAWRAVYRQADESILKFVERRGQRATIRVRSAQTSYQVESEDEDAVGRVYGEMSDADIEIGDSSDRTVDDTVEGHLEDLGYLR